MFTEKVTESFVVKNLYKMMSNKEETNKLINEDFYKFLDKLHSTAFTSTSIEQIFSSSGLIWPKLHNRLRGEI